jgi:hypothetical protein
MPISEVHYKKNRFNKRLIYFELFLLKRLKLEPILLKTAQIKTAQNGAIFIKTVLIEAVLTKKKVSNWSSFSFFLLKKKTTSS